MSDYVTPTLNQVAFGLGFAMAIFWPVYLALGAAMVFAIRRRVELSLAWTALGLNLLPFVVFVLEALAIRAQLDIGPPHGLLDTILDRFHYFVLLAGPISAAMLGIVALVRRVASKGSVHAHS